jgi:sugar-specific transcriptional regulator TrmB
MDIVELLINFSLTRQEATIYLTLFTEGALTGYEVSKITGISRSNAYTTLASLVDKGAACIIEGAATRYAPLPPGEFCRNKIRRLTEMQQQILQNMPSLKEETEGYITIKGNRHITDKIKTMIGDARKRLYLSLSSSSLNAFRPELESAVARGLKVVIITDPPYSLPDGIIYFSGNRQSQIRLITDSEIVLTGEISGGEDSACLYSKKQNLVDLIKESIKNEIKLIKLSSKGELNS